MFVARFFEVFFAEIPKDRIELLGITISKTFHESLWKTVRRIFRFYGPIDFPRLLVRWLRVKASGRNIELLARNAGIPIISAMSVNDSEYVERIRALSPDIIVSVAAPEIIRGPLLAIARLGCLNIHSGRLPAYRGMMPTFWQMKNGERFVTVTIHQMVEKLDAGGVVTTCEFELEEMDSLHRVITGTKQAGARLMIETLCKIKDQPPISPPLDMTEARFYRFPQPDDVRAFRARGHRMLWPMTNPELAPSSEAPIAMSIDVEDWLHIVNLKAAIPMDSWETKERRVEKNTRRMLELINKHGARSTCLF